MGNSARNIDLPVVGDCKSLLQQFCEAIDAKTAYRFGPWCQKLADGEATKRVRASGNYPTGRRHLSAAAREEIQSFMQREAIFTVDWQEILNFGASRSRLLSTATGDSREFLHAEFPAEPCGWEA